MSSLDSADQRVEVLRVQRVMPGEDGRDLRSRHGRNVRHSERRAVQPPVPDGGVAEYLDAAVGGGLAAHDGQQQILRASAQRDIALAVVVRPRDAVARACDRPLTCGSEAVVGGVQVQRPPRVQRRRLGVRLDRDALEPFVIPSAASSGASS